MAPLCSSSYDFDSPVSPVVFNFQDSRKSRPLDDDDQEYFIKPKINENKELQLPTGVKIEDEEPSDKQQRRIDSSFSDDEIEFPKLKSKNWQPPPGTTAFLSYEYSPPVYRRISCSLCRQREIDRLFENTN